MIKQVSKNELRKKRHERVRAKISGTSLRPRLSVFRSNSNISAQIVDDEKGITLVSSSTINLGLNKPFNVESAAKVGEDIAKKALEAGLKTVVFDRSGYLYHGKVKALADAARSVGLEF